MLVAAPASASAATNLVDTPDYTIWQPNGAVNKVVPSKDGTTAYLGGSFTYVGPTTGSSVRVDGTTGTASGNWPNFGGGPVRRIVPFPTGGWLVVGAFTTVDGIPRSGIARVDAFGRFDQTWGHDAVGSVTTAAIANGFVWIAGNMASYNGVDEGWVAQLDMTTGNATSWGVGDPGGVGYVADIEVDQSRGWLYLAGSFTNFNGDSTGAYLVRVNLASGARDGAWPQSVARPNGVVNDVAVSAAGTVYAGGMFTVAGSTTRSRAAAWNTSGALAPWNPIVNNTVTSLALNGAETGVILGGSFTTVNTSALRSRLAMVDAANGTVMTWGGDLDANVQHVERVGGYIYVGGDFRRFNGSNVRHGALRLLDSVTGDLDTTWKPMTGGPAWTFAADGSGRVLVGGDFTSAGGEERLGVAAIDVGSGELSAWNPGASWTLANDITALAVQDGVVYAGGTIQGSVRINSWLTSTAAASGATWQTFDGTMITDLEVDATIGRIYVAGNFTLYGSTPVGRLMRLSTDTGNLDTGWNANANSIVRDVDVVGANVYAVGDFTTIGGGSHGGIASLGNTSPAIASSWSPMATGPVYSIAVQGSRAFVAGPFTNLNGGTGANFEAIRLDDGNPDLSYNIPQPTATGTSVVYAGGAVGSERVYVGGSFTSYQGNKLVAELEGTGTPTTWGHSLPGSTGVNDIATSGTDVWLGLTRGVAIFHSYRNDADAPTAKLLGIDQDAADASDGIYVNGDLVVARTNTAGVRRFGVRVRAYDTVRSSSATYGAVSGIDRVTWPALASGTVGVWQPYSISVPGKPRGLLLRCWNGTSFSSANSAIAIDRDINYPGASRRADVVPALPATLAKRAGATIVGGDGSVDAMSCRWQGWVIGMSDRSSTNYRFVADVDDHVNLEVGGGTGTAGDPVFPTLFLTDVNTVGPSSPVDLSSSDAKPLRLEWFDSANGSNVVLRWDPAGGASPGSYVPVPEGAFVTGVDYARDYQLDTGGLTTSAAPTTVNVDVRDGVNLGAAVPIRVAIDNSPPAASTLTVPAPWVSSSSITVGIADGADVGLAGIRNRVLQRRYFNGATCSLGNTATWVDVQTFTNTVPSSYTDSGLASGCYQYRWVSTDNLDNQTTSVSAWTGVDSSAPSPGTVTYPTATITSGAPPSITVGYTVPTDPHSGIVSGQLRRRSSTLSNGVCGSPGAWFTVSNPSADGAYPDTLSSGNCYWYAMEGTDQAGNAASAAVGGAVQVDTQAPTATFTSPPNLIGPGTFPISFTAADATDVSRLVVRYDGPGTSDGTICDLQPPILPGTCSWTTNALAAGGYVLNIETRDSLGHVAAAAATANVTVDTAGPDVSMLPPTATGGAQFQYWNAATSTYYVNPAGSGNVTFDVIASDALTGVTGVTFPALLGTWTPSNTFTTVSSPPYRVNYGWTPGNVDPGPKTISARDGFSNPGSVAFTLESDSVVDAVGAVTYLTGYQNVSSVSVTSAASTDLQSGIASIQLEREQTAFDAARQCTGATTSTTIGSPGTTYVDTALLDGYCYRYRQVVADNVGNVDRSAWGGALRVDRTAPAVNVTPTTLTVSEGGVGAQYDVRLATPPAAGTTVSVTPGFGTQLTGSPTTPLVFDDTNWNSPRTVTLAAIDDPDVEGPAVVSVANAVTSTDPSYATVAASPVSVSISDNDTAALDVVSSASPTVTEASTSTTEPIRVRLTARPTQSVTVQVATPGGQLSASTPTLSFNGGNWNMYQTVSIAAVADTRAEANPTPASVRLTSSSGDANFNLLPERVVTVDVTDDDPAGFVTTPGAGWTYVQGTAVPTIRLQETDEPTASLTITVQGDPSQDVVFTPQAVPAGQIEIAPASVRIPAGSHNMQFTFSMRAIDDRVDEPSPHSVKLFSKLTTTDPLYAAIPMDGYTEALITDGEEPALREETPKDPPPTDTTNNDGGGGGGSTTNDDSSTTNQEQNQNTTTENPPPAQDPQPQLPTPDPNATSETTQDDGAGDEPTETVRRDQRASGDEEQDEGGNVLTRPARKVAAWARKNPVVASVAGSAAGSAALWAAGAKPLALAGKALSGGGFHLPGTPDGLDQARKLLRRGRKETKLQRLQRLWRRRRGGDDDLDLLDRLEDDWNDFYDNAA